MPIPRPKDPIRHMLDYVAEQRRQHTEELSIGRWDGEAAARELVGRVKALADIKAEMDKVLGPHSPYLEQDLTQ